MDDMKEPAKDGGKFIPDVGPPPETMGLRDWFATAALEGMLCNGFTPNEVQHGGTYPEKAYMLADMMLAARAAIAKATSSPPLGGSPQSTP